MLVVQVAEAQAVKRAEEEQAPSDAEGDVLPEKDPVAKLQLLSVSHPP